MVEHGGRLREAARRYGVPQERWIDLSTAINPFSYPVPHLDAEVWRRLPEEDDELPAAAAAYYGGRDCLAVPGTQAVLQVLPRLFDAREVAVLQPSYGEYANVWARHGKAVTSVRGGDLELAASRADVMMLCSPNNPDCEEFPRDRILGIRKILSRRGGWLVLDQAFADATRDDYLALDTAGPGLLILRSMGKFFGLAGLRIGFAIGSAQILAEVGTQLGPWAVSHPARRIATSALRDQAWQRRTRTQLRSASLRLRQLLTRHGLVPSASTSLFLWALHPECRLVQDRLARQGLLVRAFDEPRGLRFGLPGAEADWERLDEALRRAL